MSIPGFNYEFFGAFKTTVHAKTIIQPNGNQLQLKVSIFKVIKENTSHYRSNLCKKCIDYFSIALPQCK